MSPTYNEEDEIDDLEKQVEDPTKIKSEEKEEHELEQDVDPDPEPQPYIHPNGQVQFDVDVSDGVTLVSEDGMTLKVGRELLKKTSFFWKDFFGLPAKDEPIKLGEKAVIIYGVLYLIQQLEVDKAGEPDVTLPDGPTDKNEHGWTPLQTARQNYTYDCLYQVIKLCSKWQIKKGFRTIIHFHLLELLKRWNHCVASELFKIACENGWNELSLATIKEFKKFDFGKTKRFKAATMPFWKSKAGLPFWLSEMNNDRIGFKNFRSLTGAIIESTEIGSISQKTEVDWYKVLLKFTVESIDDIEE